MLHSPLLPYSGPIQFGCACLWVCGVWVPELAQGCLFVLVLESIDPPCYNVEFEPELCDSNNAKHEEILRNSGIFQSKRNGA